MLHLLAAMGCVTLLPPLLSPALVPITLLSPLTPRSMTPQMLVGKTPKSKSVATNKLARRNYEILEDFEAGVSLKGTEVKSARDGRVTLRDGFCVVKDGECPHVYFAANQPAFAETLVEGDDGQRVRVITLPGERRSMSVASGESVEGDHATHLRTPWASQHGPCQARAILALHHTRT